ncbi:MAG: hypothetical protein JWQ26_96 [Modestobacter sp.]|nr:hypothetical protein [Modestobacter sp.]
MAAEAAAQQPPLPQHGQQGPERSRRQPQGDRHERTDDPHGRENSHHAEGEHDRHQPRGYRSSAGVLAEQPQVDFVAGQQEHEAHTDVGQNLDITRRAQAEDVRADQDPPGQEQDHLR